MQKYHKKHDNVNYTNKNYVLKLIYNDENECINDTLSLCNSSKLRQGSYSSSIWQLASLLSIAPKTLPLHSLKRRI